MNKFKSAIVGLAFIAAGAIIILSNMGILSLELKRILISWQMLIIVISLLVFASKNFKAGAILLTVGAFFILPLIPGIDSDFSKNFWPFLLVVLGVIIIFSPKKKEARVDFEPVDTISKDGFINQSFFFNGSDQSFVGPVFKGGSISVGFGGTKLDLRKTELPENQDVVLKISGFCGGATILVPEDWNVEFINSSVFGGGNDSRPKNTLRNSSKKLIINVECVFGGVDIKEN